MNWQRALGGRDKEVRGNSGDRCQEKRMPCEDSVVNTVKCSETKTRATELNTVICMPLVNLA